MGVLPQPVIKYGFLARSHFKTSVLDVTDLRLSFRDEICVLYPLSYTKVDTTVTSMV